MTGMPDYWLVQRTDEEWLATAMELADDGSLGQHTPRIIGSGLTPQAALLRAITPSREQFPTPQEAAAALNRLRATRRISYRDAAALLPLSADGLKEAIHDATQSPATYRDWARVLGISDADFNLALRDIQRQLDFS